VRLFSMRYVRRVGNCGYFPIPKIVLHELGLTYGSQIELELDTAKKCLIIRPLTKRVYVPIDDAKSPEMLPFTLHQERKQPIEPTTEPAADDERVSA